MPSFDVILTAIFIFLSAWLLINDLGPSREKEISHSGKECIATYKHKASIAFIYLATL